MKTILIALNEDSLSEAQMVQIQTLLPDARLVVTEEREQMEAVLADVEIAAGWVPRELVVKAPNLRWFQQWFAGTDWLYRHPQAIEKAFMLSNVSGVHAVPMTEHILGLLLAFGRKLHIAQRKQVLGEWWRPPGETLFELFNKTILLIGVGAIGQRTAQMAKALGMRVLGIRRDPTAEVAGVARMAGTDKLLELLPEADFVVIILPLTEETRGLIGQHELQVMKSSAYIINVGRGPIIDQTALISALQKREIAGAGLDVFEDEPLPKESPLWQMENVIITGHYAGATPQYNRRAMTIFLDNLQRYQKGEPLRNLIDKRRGY
jgi:phosphoglycerate dehydrogenase-like enzyme